MGDFCNNNPVSAMGIVYLHYYLDNNNGFLYTRENVWLTNVMTGDEKPRMKKYVQLYNETYNSVKKADEEA